MKIISLLYKPTLMSQYHGLNWIDQWRLGQCCSTDFSEMMAKFYNCTIWFSLSIEYLKSGLSDWKTWVTRVIPSFNYRHQGSQKHFLKDMRNLLEVPIITILRERRNKQNKGRKCSSTQEGKLQLSLLPEEKHSSLWQQWEAKKKKKKKSLPIHNPPKCLKWNPTT